jgi:murein DD-endopeptidase MepM/ murein hydrolase activator NlpD
LVVVLLAAASAEARTRVGARLRERDRITALIRHLRHTHGAWEGSLRHQLESVRGRLADAEHRKDPDHESSRFLVWRQAQATQHRILRSDRRVSLRLRKLDARRRGLSDWLETWGVLRVCPVPRYTAIYDDFGELVQMEGVEPHVHMGNDITAPTGSPILAPFDGYASASTSPLGGLQVRVIGDHGYVFNAHLSAYGRLGSVRAGDVVGYVGATGDSTAPHDHFEWHPWDGPAVDPHTYLLLACTQLPPRNAPSGH